MMDAEAEEYALALRARDGDREALAQLVERLRLRLFALAYADLRHYEDAQDAVAGALLQICLHVTELRQPESVRAWMQSIVRNEVRRLRRSPRPEATEFNEMDVEAEDVRRSLLRLDIETAMRRLPEEQARALRLFYLADLSIREIAKQTGRAEGTIKNWLHRGRRHLAEQMKEYAPMRTPTPSAAIVHTDLDAAAIRKLRTALRGAGYSPKVITPADLSALPESLKPFRFLVVDEWIGGRSALELLLHLKADAATAPIPVCLLCADPSDFTTSAYFVAGVDRLINKNNVTDRARLKEIFLEVTTVPEGLPLIALRDRVYFPHMTFPLYIGRKMTVRAVEEARVTGRFVLVVTQKAVFVDNPGPEDLYSIGIAAKVTEVFRIPDESLRVTLRAVARVRVLEYLQTDPFFRVRVEALPEEKDRSPEGEDLMRRVREELQQVEKWGTTTDPQTVQAMRNGALSTVRKIDEPGIFADLLTPRLPLEIAEQQQILETLPPRERLEKLSAFLRTVGQAER